ncbi:enoyl-CoA hydratase/isomerase [Burkholderia sp. YI23]|nr:enoyl-CoA hydratase/isomerase [Burkholderia sp. YI23]
MNADKVPYERRGHIALVTLDEPQRRNALSREIVRGVSAALRRALDDNARAVVIAANGPAFCAGANIDDLRDGWMEGPAADEDPAVMFRRMAEFERPVIAAVHGPALGGGMELTLACDLVVACEAAWFAMPELGHGVIPNTAVALLPRVVGMRRALDLILTRRRVSAGEALDIGLVNRVVPTHDVLDSALALGGQVIEAVPPGALKAAKRNLRAHAAIDWQRVVASPRDVPKTEWQEGLDAFTQKRAPDYERFWRDDSTALQGIEGD